ncbi:MAG TPA: type II secretion system F family protein [Candidatus Cloacimonetes bacterium]|nr:type II secretion system F family protein [Candidatus Cloacimonadota bacterium]
MLKEFFYSGISQFGKPVQGIVLAYSSPKAKQLVQQLEEKHKFKVKNIIPKKTFLYTVKLPNGKKVTRKQTAFTKKDLANALTKMGYANAKIQPALLDFKFRPSFASILMFVNLSSFMLKEKMSYDKILRMLAEEESNATLKETLKNIEGDLKKGKEGTEVFARYTDVFGKFPAYMLGLATKSGNMAEVYDATAKFMERDMEYRKSIKQALLAPLLTVVAMVAAVLYYVISIFPATARLFVKFGMKLPPLTDATLKMSAYLGENWWWMFLVVIIPMGIIALWWRTKKGRIWRDHFIIKLPVVGHLLHKSSIEIFFRVFAAVYGGAENNIETLQASAEACRNAFIEKKVKEVAIPLMLTKGDTLVSSLAQAAVFNRTTLSRLKTGAETGNVLSAAKQISAFYEKETTYKLQNIIQSIQMVVGAFIAIVITALTIVSAEIAMVSPTGPGM